MKEVLIVSIGSFFGGGMRYWVSKMVQSCTVIAFPFGTMAVNVAGCLIIGFLSGLNWREGGWMSPSAKLLLTTGFCGGFTTFSTFMNEELRKLDERTFLAVFSGVPTFDIKKEDLPCPVIDLLAVKTQVFPSKGECRKMIQGGGVSINKDKVASIDYEVSEKDIIDGKYILVQKGKKNYYLLRVI